MARIKDDSSDEEDEVPLSKRAAPGEAEVLALPPAREPPPVDDSEEEDDVPLSKRKALVEAVSSKPAPAAKKQKVEPKPANGKPKPTPAVKAKPKPQPADESDSDVEPAAKKAKKPASTNKEKEGPSTSYGDRWYEEVDGSEWKRGGVKWKTLEHGGVMFPPLYTPHGKKLMYEGKPVVLSAAQEEVATMFAAMKDTDYGKNPAFQKNFMEAWRPLLKQTAEGKVVKELAKCDFGIIAAYLEEEKERKKNMTKEEKAAAKAEKDAAESHCAYALIDGRKEKVGNFRVEPPGLFRGRGAHPKMGKLKGRIWPEDITINIGQKGKVPVVPDLGDGKKHKWGEVVHDNTVTWLAKWVDTINGEVKYVMLAANSSWKGMSDLSKYEKARELKKHIGKIRTDYMKGMRSSDAEAQQKSVAVYLIDRLALRVGNEKNTDEEADTVGCTSLRVEHVFLDVGDNRLRLKFLGKDSIEYDATTEVIPEAYQCLKMFIAKKKPADQVFDKVDPTALNDYFKNFMEGLSAKVFRTYNASITLDAELKKTADQVTQKQRQQEGDVNALMAYYNVANKNVAELCNHQRATPASHANAIAKMDEKIETAKAELKEANKDGKAKAEALAKRLGKMLADRRNKDETKNVSLGTSKINYNDPRVTVAWCKKHEVPIHRPFPKTLCAKFTWAMSVEPSYEF